MGRGIELRCRKCDDKNTYLQGIGFMYAAFLEETKKEVCDGKYGDALKQAIETFPDAEIEARYEIYYCSHCNELEQGVDIKISYGDKIFKNEHICGKCSKRLQIAEKNYRELQKLPCPSCGATDSCEVGFLMWD